MQIHYLKVLVQVPGILAVYYCPTCHYLTVHTYDDDKDSSTITQVLPNMAEVVKVTHQVEDESPDRLEPFDNFFDQLDNKGDSNE